MSGLIGLYFRDGRPVSRREIESMSAPVRYRGPDRAGYWVEGCAGLGSQQLWTTPEAPFDTLPLVHGDKTIVADARLDNREELIDALGLRAGDSPALGDAGLILAGYERWGEETPERLLGDFAFAIWDRASRRFFCARDHLGVRQFHFYLSQRTFAFATEISSLLALPEIPRTLNEAKLADMLASFLDDHASTLYQAIFRLLPGTTLLVGPDTTSRRAYWTLDPQREIRLRSDEYAEEYRELLTEAIRCRLRGPRPIGSTLSGGLDSSSTTCLARDLLARAGDQALHTFTAVYDAVPVNDERQYAGPVIRQGSVVAHFVHPDRLGPLTDWIGVPDQQDEPIWTPQTPLIVAVLEAAREAGVRVLLESTAGDIVVGHGTEYLGEMGRRRRYLALARELMARGRRRGEGPGKVFKTWIIRSAPPSLLHSLRRLRGRQTDVNDQVPLDPAFRARLGLAHTWSGYDVPGLTSQSSHREAQWAALSFHQHNIIGRVGVHKLAARMGVELRDPYLDRRLVEFCLAVPPEQKLGDGWSRWYARRAMDGILPPEVCWRIPKINFSAVVNYGLTMLDKQLMDDILVNEPGPIAEYVNMSEVRSRYARFIASPQGELGTHLWRIAYLGLWLRERERRGVLRAA